METQETPSPCKRQFIWLSQAWYSQANLPPHGGYDDEIFLTAPSSNADEDDPGEFAVSWPKRVPNGIEFSFFSNGICTARLFADFLDAMDARKDTKQTPADVAKLLESLGVIDVTLRTPEPDDENTFRAVLSAPNALSKLRAPKA